MHYLTKPIFIKSNIYNTKIPAKTYFYYITTKKGYIKGLFFKCYALTGKKNTKLRKEGYILVKNFKDKKLWLRTYPIKHTTLVKGLVKLKIKYL